MNITTAEAAEILGVSQEAITSLIRRKHLPAIEPLGKGRGYLVPREAVQARLRLKRKGKLPKGGTGMHKGSIDV